MSQDQRPDAAQAKALVAGGATLVDVRTQEEWDEGHVKGALLLPHREVAQKAASILPDKNAPIVLYCRSGNRTELAKRALDQMGYTNVRSMTGGFEDLKQTGIATE
jgi:phage shock protein E